MEALPHKAVTPMPTTRSSGYGSAGLDTVRGGERLYAWMLPSYCSAFEFAARACETARQVRDPLPHFGKKKKIRKFDRVTAANMPLFAAFLLRTEAHRGWFLGAVCILCTVKIWGLCCLCSQWRAVHKWELFVLGSYAWECSKRGLAATLYLSLGELQHDFSDHVASHAFVDVVLA